MKLALIGQGNMGQLVAKQATNAGMDIGLILTSRHGAPSPQELAELLTGHDVAIDFSVGERVLSHIEACARAGIPLVEGTTGWNSQEAEARKIIAQFDGALVYGANFSIGVNVFYKLVKHAAELFQKLDDYEPFIEEAHHSRKRDAPSGTALRIKEIMAASVKKPIPISSTRAGNIPGTHRVGLDSAADQITLSHMARNREGFASGAVAAAKWIVGRKGIYEFSQVIEDVLKGES